MKTKITNKNGNGGPSLRRNTGVKDKGPQPPGHSVQWCPGLKNWVSNKPALSHGCRVKPIIMEDVIINKYTS